MTTPHTIFNPEELSPPLGFSHAVAAAPGRTVYLGGQTAHGAEGRLRGGTVAEQFEYAAANVVVALAAAGGGPEHLVWVHVYVTDAEYRRSLDKLATVWGRQFARHYLAVALFEVVGLFDPAAKVELVCVAVVPGGAA